MSKKPAKPEPAADQALTEAEIAALGALNYEEAVARLERIIDRIEAGEVGLEERVGEPAVALDVVHGRARAGRPAGDVEGSDARLVGQCGAELCEDAGLRLDPDLLAQARGFVVGELLTDVRAHVDHASQLDGEAASLGGFVKTGATGHG